MPRSAIRIGGLAHAQGRKAVVAAVQHQRKADVGTCTALHLAFRGYEVTLVDRREPGRETSYGNAGIIQREAVEPYAFPRGIPALFHYQKYFDPELFRDGEAR